MISNEVHAYTSTVYGHIKDKEYSAAARFSRENLRGFHDLEQLSPFLLSVTIMTKNSSVQQISTIS